MAQKQYDTKYLQSLVGEALARGCAETVKAQPNDPVDYLGNWLLRYVKNVEIVGEYAKEKEAQLEARKAELEAAQAAAAEAKERENIRRAAVIDLASTVAEPRQLLQKAVELVVKHTAAGAAYAAAVAEPEEPDWQFPEDPEDPAAIESDDEPDPNTLGEGEGEAAAAEPDEPAAEGEGEGEGEDGEAGVKIPKPIDYSKKYLSYLAATAGQEFMLTAELYRPAPPPEDDPEAKAEPVPFTFRILDEKRPMVYTPNVAFEASIRFIRNFPKIGAYQACGVQSPSTGEFKAIIAADTLFPEAGGQQLSQEDQDFIWHVSRALSQAYEAVEKKAAEKQAEFVAAAAAEGWGCKERMESLKKAIHEVYFPPPPVDENGIPIPAAAPAAPEPAVEPAEAEPAAEEDAEDPVSILKAEVKELEQALHEAEVTREKAAEALETAQKVLVIVKDYVLTSQEGALPVLRHMRTVPQATFHVLKAVLHVLGKDPDTFKNWKRAFMYFEKAMFEEMNQFDATQERDVEAWKHARCCYKALPEDRPERKLAEEMPDSQLGVLMLMWLKQVRKVGRRAAAFRASREAEDKLHDQLDAKRVELVEAEKKKAEEEEAARLAAEAEAAAAAEAGEGEEGEEEED